MLFGAFLNKLQIAWCMPSLSCLRPSIQTSTLESSSIALLLLFAQITIFCPPSICFASLIIALTRASLTQSAIIVHSIICLHAHRVVQDTLLMHPHSNSLHLVSLDQALHSHALPKLPLLSNIDMIICDG